MSAAYLRRMADEGKIPYLVVSGRRRFAEDQVRAALAALAAKPTAANTTKKPVLGAHDER